MQKRTFSRAEWLLLLGVLAWVIAFGLGGFTLAFSLPQFTALQKNGVQREATVIRKQPYGSICKDRTCTPFALNISFNASPNNIIQIRLAYVEVSQAEYNATNIGDSKKIIFLEKNPDKIWLAEKALAWSPWGNFFAAGTLFVIGGFFLFSSRRLRQKG